MGWFLLLALFPAKEQFLKMVEPVELDFAGRTRFVFETNVRNDDILGLELFVNGESAWYTDAEPFETELDMSRFAEGRVAIRAVLTKFDDKTLVVQKEGRNYAHFESQQVNLVRVPVTIEGEGAAEAYQLSDFALFENGVPQKPAEIFDATTPLSLVLVIDLSLSMERYMPMLKSAMRKLIDSLKEGDSVRIIGFSHNVFEISPPETDLELVKKRLHRMRSEGSTNLYGGLWSGVQSGGQSSDRRAVVLFTDGDHDLDGMPDQYKKTPEDSIKLAREYGVPVFTMGLGAGIKTEVLDQVATETGGRFFRIRRSRGITDSFAMIGEDLRRQYLICYYTQSERKGWHDMKVVLKREQRPLRYPKKLYFQ